MKKQALIALCLGSLLAFSSSIAVAKDDNIPDNAVKMSKALESLKTKGFNVVRKIEFDDDAYTASVINAEGKEVKIYVNSQTGEVSPPKESNDSLSALEVAKKVEQAGYQKIYKIDTQWFRDRYEVKAYDRNGKKVELDVDAKSGKILK